MKYRSSKCPKKYTFACNNLHSHRLTVFHFHRRIKIDIHFSLIAAAVTYIMWRSVGEDKIKKMEGKKIDEV